jgi:curved DNA-binding protein
MDYYSTLGLNRGASDADIKKAYRSMAMKHHPDRGGDEKKFKEISQAYEFLSDPEKKQIIDMGGDPNAQSSGFRGQRNPFEFHFNTGDMNDIFGNFGFGGFGRQPQRNKSLNVSIEIALEDVLTGKEVNAEIGIPGGRKKMITIEIPPGIEHGQQIRYSGMGDHSIPELRPGDLIVNVMIKHHPKFRREGDSLLYDHIISVWDALVGSTVEIKTLDNKNLSINIPSGTQPETVLSCRGEGLPNVRSKQRGNLLIRIKVQIPKNLSTDQLLKITKLKDDL